VDGGAGNDVVSINAIHGVTTIGGGAGDDVMNVNFLADGTTQTFQNNINAVLNLHGQAGGDQYFIGLAGSGTARINVDDQNPTADLGVNSMVIYGTAGNDTFFFRPNAVLSVTGGVVGERVQYNSDLNGGMTVYGRAGDDTFVLDDNNVVTTIYGEAGDDTFQVGQVFQSPRDAYAGLAQEDTFETTLTTRGYLSNGVSQSTTLFGGAGNDSFNVYHNKANLWMYGEEDDDSFRVRAFVRVDPNDPKAPITNVNGGQGADFISYTVNSPIQIEGGDGFDTLTVVGTEFGDDFVVNEKGVYGA